MKIKIKVESYADAYARYLESVEMDPRGQAHRRRRRKPRSKNVRTKPTKQVE